MNSLRVRRLIRKHDDLGHAVAGLYLIAYYLLVRRRRATAAVVVTLLPVCLLLLHAQPLPDTGSDRCKCLVDAPTAYRVTDLGMPSGAQLFIPAAVSGGNQIAATALMDDEKIKAFHWNNGRMQDLGSLGGRQCAATGINESGQVVGVSLTRDEVLHGFVWQNGRMRDLSRKPEEFTVANGINDGGQIVGWAYNDRADSIRATLWQKDKPNELGVLPGDTDSIAAAINGGGDVVGYCTRDAEQWHSFLYHNGRMEALAMPGKSGFALGINAAAQVVGAVDNGEHYRAFLSQDRRSIELGTLGGEDSIATGINAAAQVVGMSDTARGEVHAFLWENGKLIDLNSRISSDSGWVLLTAYGIGKRGQIVGLGLHQGELRAFLLTPDGGKTAPTETQVSQAATGYFTPARQRALLMSAFRPSKFSWNAPLGGAQADEMAAMLPTQPVTRQP